MSKKHSRRPCPALGREITSKECGGDRQSRIACTADCPFNPFALQNYDELLEIEQSADVKARARLFKSMPPGRHAQFTSQLRSFAGDTLEIEQAYRHEFFHRPGPDGRDFLSAWEADGWAGLNNDERTYYQGHRRMAPMLLEIQGCLADGQIVMMDLRHPGLPPFLVLDRTLAGRAGRFTSLLTWHFPLPHYGRLFSANFVIGPLGPCSTVETVDEIVRHLGGPADPDEVTAWLALHFNEVVKAYQETGAARLADTRRLADRRRFLTTWSFSGPPDTLFDRLNASPGLQADALSHEEQEAASAAYHILEEASNLSSLLQNFGATVIGRLLIHSGSLSARCIGQGNHESLKPIVDRAAGDLLTWAGTDMDEPPAPPAAPAPPLVQVPPRLLENPTLHEHRSYARLPEDPDLPPVPIKQALQDIQTPTYRGFIDIPAGELNGLTLRAAATDPALRPVVVEWMKKLVNSIDLLYHSKGIRIEINDQLTELGLPELIFDPPAGRTAAEDDDEAEASDEAEAGSDDLPEEVRQLIAGLT